MKTIYDYSVPVFLRYLSRLAELVGHADAHCRRHGLPQADVLQARLAPDMHPFASQVRIAADFALRACAPLAGVATPDHGAAETDLAGLARRIDAASDFLRALPAARFDGAAGRRVTEQAGAARLDLEGDTFLFHYALPNFFFHVSMAYANVRALGVDIGKADFDGFHHYPAEAA